MSRQDGLSSNKTYQAVEDHDGFIWVSTDRGIDRFDGREFVHYELEMLDEIASMGYQFYFVLMDSKNNIFVCSKRGHVFRLDRNIDQFVRLKDFEQHYGKYVFTAYVDSRNHLLLGTPNDLIIYNYETSLFQESSLIHRVHAVQEYDGGYIMGIDDGLISLSTDFSTSEFLGKWNDDLGTDIHIRSIKIDSINNRIWFGNQNKGLNYYDISTGMYLMGGFGKDFHEFPVWDIEMPNDSTLLVGTDGAGIFVVDLNMLLERYQFSADQEDDNSISSNVVHDILACSNSTYFITTDVGGLSIWSPLMPKFEVLAKQKGQVNSLKNNVIHSIVEISPGKIAFGTDRGVSIWNRVDNTWDHLSGTSDIGKNNVVTTMTTSTDGSLWVGYFLKNIEILGGYDQYKKLPSEVLQSRNSKAILLDEERNTLWMGRTDQEQRLISYDFNKNIFHTFSVQPVTDIESHPLGKILVGTRFGLHMIDKSTYKDKLYNGLSNELNRITCLLVDSKDYVWIGSDGGGLARIKLNNESQVVFDETSGLASSQIYSIEEDELGRMWVATDAGLSRIDPESFEIVNFFTSDGIAVGDFMYNASCRASDGTILVGGTGGVTYFNPLTLQEPTTTHNLVLTDLHINQEKIVAVENSVLHAPLNVTDTLVLAHNENSFSLEFTNIDFVHPEQARYSWKLEGVDHDWTTASLTGKAVYSNLNPGNYVFRVRLQPFTTSETDIVERVVYIEIMSPIWKTLWAFLLYAIIIIVFLLAALYFNKLMHDVNSANDRLKYLVNMAHEIKTPLSLIRAPIGDVLQENDNEEIADKLQMAMANVERLQKRIGRFLDFKRLNENASPHLERMDAVAFIKNKMFAFRLLAEKHKIQLNLETTLSELVVFSDPEMLDRIMNNLLSNAIKYNKPGGYVNIRIMLDKTEWKVTVKDSGIGIPRKEQKNAFKLFFRASNAVKSQISGSGVGLVLTRDLIKVLKGSLKFKSKEGQGTTFYITLPIGEPGLHDVIYEEEPLEFTDSLITDEEEPEIGDGKYKVLIVEDDEELRHYMKKELNKTYCVIESSDGQMALDIVQKKLPDLVLSDVALPQMNGRQLCMHIKSHPTTSHIPVILLTGLDSKDNYLRGLAAGADDYMAKPFDTSILFAKIESLLSNRKVLKEKFISANMGDLDIDFQNELDKEFVEKTKGLVEENLSDSEFSVRMLYTSVGMSRTAFYHKLKSLIDLSPAEFIKLIRLNKARQLLRSGRYNINEVAYRCGFSDAKYFSTCFKRQFGQSPSTFAAAKST